MKRYGIFGGAFNPPHIAHSIVAEDVRQQLNLDRIIFIPSGNPPLKDKDNIPSPEIRYEMAKIAFGNDSYFEISDIEIRKSSDKVRSYTVDTLISLQEEYKNEDVKLYLIIGIDNLIDFPKWKEPQKLFGLSEVIVMNRPGYDERNVSSEFSSRVKFVNIPMLDISSTAIRKSVTEGRRIKYLVKPEIEEFIIKNNLYK